MSARSEYTRANWDSLDEFPQPPLPKDHPWPSRDIFTYKVLGIPLRCEYLALSMGHFKPGESLEHHGHREAEEVYILMQGSSQIMIGDEVIEARQFDVFRIPAPLPHSVYNHSDADCYWTFIGAPIDEFLEDHEYYND